MTIRQEFICDRKGCPSRKETKSSEEIWLELGAYDGAHQFCSVPCLSAWLDAMPPAADPSPGVVFTCDNDKCEKEILLKPGEQWPVWCEMKVDGGPYRLGFCSRMCLYEFLHEHICKYMDDE